MDTTLVHLDEADAIEHNGSWQMSYGASWAEADLSGASSEVEDQHSQSLQQRRFVFIILNLPLKGNIVLQ